jgi:hypothetical protein
MRKKETEGERRRGRGTERGEMDKEREDKRRYEKRNGHEEANIGN